MKIELWILRTENEAENAIEVGDKMAATKMGKTTSKKDGKNAAGGKKTKASTGFEDTTIKAKTPEKTLEGHKKAIREIAYSTTYKILVSVGFDF
jgi:hypothetical protein